MLKRFHSLGSAAQIVIAIILGVIFGALLGQKAAFVKIIGTIFIDLIQMLIAPLVFAALASAITSSVNLREMGKVGAKAFGVFLITTFLCVSFGMVLAAWFNPGAGVTIDLSKVAGSGTALQSGAKSFNLQEFIVELVPQNAVSAFMTGNIVQIIIFTVFFAVCLNLIGEKGKPLSDCISALNDTIYKMINYVLLLTPYGVFSFVAWLIGTQDIAVVKSLLKLVFVVYAACIVAIYVIIGGLIFFWAGLNPIPFFKKMIPLKLLVFTTASSTAALPLAMRTAQEKLGCSKSVSTFVLSLGTAVNTNGSALYISIASIFAAQLYGVHLDMSDYFVILFTTTLLSLGIAGIPGASIFMLSTVLASVNVPVEAIGIILGVDRFLDMIRSVLNACGDMLGVLIADKTSGSMNVRVYNSNNADS